MTDKELKQFFKKIDKTIKNMEDADRIAEEVLSNSESDNEEVEE